MAYYWFVQLINSHAKILAGAEMAQDASCLQKFHDSSYGLIVAKDVMSQQRLSTWV